MKRKRSTNGERSQLAEELESAGEQPGEHRALLRRAARRLSELETTEFAARRMQQILNDIAVALKGKRAARYRWDDLPERVRKLARQVKGA